MTQARLRLPYDDADAPESMRRDPKAAGNRLGVGREAMIERCVLRRAATDHSAVRKWPLGCPQVATRLSASGHSAVRKRPLGTRPPPAGADGGLRTVLAPLVLLALLRGAAADQWNESPQAQEPPALGLSMVKPCFSMESTKSIMAPLR